MSKLIDKKKVVKKQSKKRIGYGKAYEKKILQKLTDDGVDYKFEGARVPYSKYYKPDIVLSNGIMIEIKTYLKSDEQSKLIAIKKCNPDIDLRILFEKPEKQVPGTKLTHGEWADKNGFIWAGGEIPSEWLI